MTPRIALVLLAATALSCQALDATPDLAKDTFIMKHKKEAATAPAKADPSAPESKPLVKGISNTVLAIIVGAVVFIILACCAFCIIRSFQHKEPEPAYVAPPVRTYQKEPEPVYRKPEPVFAPPPIQRLEPAPVFEPPRVQRREPSPVRAGSPARSLGGTMVTIAPSSPRTEVRTAPMSPRMMNTQPAMAQYRPAPAPVVMNTQPAMVQYTPTSQPRSPTSPTLMVNRQPASQPAIQPQWQNRQ